MNGLNLRPAAKLTNAAARNAVAAAAGTIPPSVVDTDGKKLIWSPTPAGINPAQRNRARAKTNNGRSKAERNSEAARLQRERRRARRPSSAQAS